MKLMLILVLLLKTGGNLSAQAALGTNGGNRPNLAVTNAFLKAFQWQSNQPALAGISNPGETEINYALYQEQTEYDIFSYRHLRRVFNWQFTSSVIIFWLVVFIVLTGVVFSGVQFYIAMLDAKHSMLRTLKNVRDPKTSGSNAPSEIEQLLATDLDVSAKGLKIKSPVLGVIILAFSMVFFYLYLIHVYPITIVGNDPEQQTPASAVAKP